MSEAFHGNSGVVMIIAKARRKGHGVFWGLSIMVFAWWSILMMALSLQISTKEIYCIALQQRSFFFPFSLHCCALFAHVRCTIGGAFEWHVFYSFPFFSFLIFPLDVLWTMTIWCVCLLLFSWAGYLWIFFFLYSPRALRDEDGCTVLLHLRGDVLFFFFLFGLIWQTSWKMW